MGKGTWAMAKGHRLNTSIVLAAVHGLSGLFRSVPAVEPSLFRPPPHRPLFPSLISHLASVDVKQNGPGPCRIACDKSAMSLLESRERRYYNSDQQTRHRADSMTAGKLAQDRPTGSKWANHCEQSIVD